MTKANRMPAIPAKWTKYIKGCARSYAYGMFSIEDAVQTGLLAFIRARALYVPARGVFDHYAKAAIRNALQNARVAEQRNYDLPANPDDGGGDEIPPPPWAAEEAVLGNADLAKKVEAVSSWTRKLPPKLAAVYRGVYSRDLSQRQFAATVGVSQGCISQRNTKLLELAGEALADLAGG